MNKTLKPLVRRSALFIPANRTDFMEKAWTRNADTIIIDLEDSIAPSEKESARGFVEGSIALAARGGADVMVRTNSEPELLEKDLEASVWPGIWGIGATKLESAEQVKTAEEMISRLEQVRGIEKGSICITAFIETAVGFLRAEEILKAGTRIRSLIFGTEDFVKDIGMDYTTGNMLYYPKMHFLILAKAFGLHCSGLMGRNTVFNDLDALYQIAREAFQYGFNGSTCIHPSQVEIMNRAFSPSEENISRAREIVAVFEESIQQGHGAVKWNNTMLDKPIVERAQELLNRVKVVEEKDAYKAKCIENTKKALSMT